MAAMNIPNPNNIALENAQCSIHTKYPNGEFEKCNKLAYITITNDHIRIANRKNYPFYIDQNCPILLICQTHQKFIQSAPKFNEQTYRINLNQYQVDERRDKLEFIDSLSRANEDEETEANETLRENVFDQIFSNEYENLHERFRGINMYKQSNLETYEQNVEEMASRVKLEDLSANALRRYKKFFNLPNRSGASSKAQLSQGIREHFESIPLDVSDTTANFLYTVYKKQNRLDFPMGDEQAHQ